MSQPNVYHLQFFRAVCKIIVRLPIAVFLQSLFETRGLVCSKCQLLLFERSTARSATIRCASVIICISLSLLLEYNEYSWVPFGLPHHKIPLAKCATDHHGLRLCNIFVDRVPSRINSK